MEVALLVLVLISLFAAVLLIFIVTGTYQKILELERLMKKQTEGNPLATMNKYQKQYKDSMDAKEFEAYFEDMMKRFVRDMKMSQP